MRRIYIIFYWVFGRKNGVGLIELLKFLMKPKMETIGNRFIKAIHEEEQFYKIEFKEMIEPLFWPKCYSASGIYQVSAETFDRSDWHNYQSVFKVDDSEVLLDVGAAEGLFALSVAKQCNKIILIEPNPNFVDALKKTFSSLQTDFEILEFAVGESNGYTTFSAESLSGSIKTDSQSSHQVAIRKIDDLINMETNITFLKADIEGFELNMLKGAEKIIKRCKPKIVITTYHRENNADEIIALIRSFVSEYKFVKRGIFHEHGKPVTVHLWVS